MQRKGLKARDVKLFLIHKREVSRLKCEGGRSHFCGWSGRQTGKAEWGCYFSGQAVVERQKDDFLKELGK